jgi:hypothetical protein
LINQLDLLAAQAGLYLLLRRDGTGGIASGLIVDKFGDVVALRKSGQQLFPVLMNARPLRSPVTPV